MIETPEQKELIQALYDQNFKALYTYAKNAIDDGDLALEAVQETFVTACSKPNALIGHPNQPGWLMQTLKYVLKNMERGRADLEALLSSCGADLGSDCQELGMVEMDIDCSRLVGEDNWRLYKAVTLKRMTVLEAAEERPVASRPWRIRRRRRVLRLALATAAVMVLAVSAAFAVSHVGWFRAWNIDYLWSKLARSEQSAQAEVMPKPDYYDEVATALEAIGAPDHMIPLWLPEGYEMMECVTMDIAYYTSLTVSFRDESGGEIIFTFSGYATEDFSSSYVADSTSLFTKDNGDPDIFTAGGIDHSILTNMDSYRAVWWRESFECSVSGYESRDDLIKTIESMYMEVMK